VPAQSFTEATNSTSKFAVGLALLVFLGWLLIIWLWPPVIYSMTADDSYYYLVTARNAAQGFGFTFDQINHTNGFHPLWEYLLVPLARIVGADMEVFVRSVLTIQLILVFLGTGILGRALQDQKLRLLISTAALMVNFYFTKTLVNGLESALQWFLMCATLARMLHLLDLGVKRTSNWQFFGLGLLCGLTILSRLTAVWFAGAVLLLSLMILGRQSTGRYFRPVIGRLAAAATGTALIVVPYLSGNYLSTGHFETVSAAVKISRANSFRPLLWAAFTGYAVVGLTAMVVAWRSDRLQPATRRYAWGLFPIAFYVALQGAADAMIRHVMVPEIWSMAPLSLMAALLLAYSFMMAISPDRGALWRPAAVSMTIALVGFAAFTWQYISNPESYRWYLKMRGVADWVRANTDQSAVIGSFDAGIVGGYSDRRTVNLDGLINSWEYKKYMEDGKTEEWITEVCPVDYLTIGFIDDQFNAETLSEYCWSPTGAKDAGRIQIDLSKWNVVHGDRAQSRSWMHGAALHEYFFLVLTRKAEGTPLPEYLRQLGRL
jgi:hypothetical protein